MHRLQQLKPNCSKQCMIFLIKVPESLDTTIKTAPITIMTRSPVDRKSNNYIWKTNI